MYMSDIIGFEKDISTKRSFKALPGGEVICNKPCIFWSMTINDRNVCAARSFILGSNGQPLSDKTPIGECPTCGVQARAVREN